MRLQQLAEGRKLQRMIRQIPLRISPYLLCLRDENCFDAIALSYGLLYLPQVLEPITISTKS